ncbi:hypothetical protein MGN70_001757 [Eutypa lata]|nr:hypothetical protein MGN70_001757 [Eutypa lata]
MKVFYASIVIYSVGMCFLKISILLQYRRIFAVAMMQKLTLIGLIFEGCWAITATFLLALICVPVASFWDDSIEGRCINQLVVWYLNATINLVTDFLVFSMPLPVISSLQLRKPQKIMLMGIFCLGFFGCIISILRLRTLSVAAETDDPTWDNVDAAIWSFLELSIGVTVSCLPTLRPLLVKITPNLFASITPRRSGGNVVHGTGSQNPYHFPYPHSHSRSHGGGTELPSARTWTQSQSRARTAVMSTQTQTQTIKDSDSTSDLFDGAGSGSGSGIASSHARPSENEDRLNNNSTYNVEVSSDTKSQGSIWSSGGRSSRSSDEKRPGNNNSNKNISWGGITATTQITQEVEVTRDPV